MLPDELAVARPDIPGFRAPHQQRSQRTLERITEAVEDLLLERGPGDLSVRDLIRRAGTSVGAFYSRFDDRDAALHYASHAFWERSRGAWRDYLGVARWKAVASAVLVASITRSLTRAMLRDAQPIRAFVRLSLSLPDGDVRRRIAEHDRFIATEVAALLLATGEGIRNPAPEQAAREGFLRVLAAVRDHVVYQVETPRDAAADRRLILCVCQMYGRYLDVHPVPANYGELLALVKT